MSRGWLVPCLIALVSCKDPVHTRRVAEGKAKTYLQSLYPGVNFNIACEGLAGPIGNMTECDAVEAGSRTSPQIHLFCWVEGDALCHLR
jgi:hypothetical protein